MPDTCVHSAPRPQTPGTVTTVLAPRVERVTRGISLATQVHQLAQAVSLEDGAALPT